MIQHEGVGFCCICLHAVHTVHYVTDTFSTGLYVSVSGRTAGGTHGTRYGLNAAPMARGWAREDGRIFAEL